MVRITSLSDDGASTMLRIEGDIASEATAVVEREVLAHCGRRERVALELSGIRHVDAAGIALLKRLVATATVRLVNCPALIGELIERG